MADNEKQFPRTRPSSDRPPSIEGLGTPRRGATHAHRHVHIVLLGLMGSGKSTVGRIVARELGRPFVDSDSIVQHHSGLAPYEVASQSGLDRLHEIEARSARHVLATNHAVVFAAAASLPETLTPEELSRVWTAWLDAPPSVLAGRIEGDGPRPGLDSSPAEVLEAQARERAPHARVQASFVIDTDSLTPEQVAERICDQWRQFAARYEAPAAT